MDRDAIFTGVSRSWHGRRTALALLAAGVAALAAAVPASAAPQASVSQYGGTGGVVETIPGPPATGPTTTPPGQDVEDAPPVESEVPVVDDAPEATAQDAPTAVRAPDRGLLSLPNTGMTVGLVLAAGLLLAGVGLATRRLAAPARP